MLADLWRVAPVREPELMDDPSLPEDEHLAALDALGRINVLSRTASQLARAIGRVVGGARASPDRPLHIVDIACGGGDVTVALAKRLSRPRYRLNIGPVVITGIDVSRRAIDRATALARGRHSTVDFAVHDVVAEGCPPCDLATSSLFLHHLDDDAAESVLRGMAAAARVGVVVSDLVRSGAGLALAVAATTFICRSRVARVDGPLSVRAARTVAEYRDLCRRAELDGTVVRRSWPERVVIEWQKRSAGAAAAGET